MVYPFIAQGNDVKKYCKRYMHAYIYIQTSYYKTVDEKAIETLNQEPIDWGSIEQASDIVIL